MSDKNQPLPAEQKCLKCGHTTPNGRDCCLRSNSLCFCECEYAASLSPERVDPE